MLQPKVCDGGLMHELEMQNKGDLENGLVTSAAARCGGLVVAPASRTPPNLTNQCAGSDMLQLPYIQMTHLKSLRCRSLDNVECS